MSESKPRENSAGKEPAAELHQQHQEQIWDCRTPAGGGWVTPPPDSGFSASTSGSPSVSAGAETFVRPWADPEPVEAQKPLAAPDEAAAMPGGDAGSGGAATDAAAGTPDAPGTIDDATATSEAIASETLTPEAAAPEAIAPETATPEAATETGMAAENAPAAATEEVAAEITAAPEMPDMDALGMYVPEKLSAETIAAALAALDVVESLVAAETFSAAGAPIAAEPAAETAARSLVADETPTVAETPAEAETPAVAGTSAEAETAAGPEVFPARAPVARMSPAAPRRLTAHRRSAPTSMKAQVRGMSPAAAAAGTAVPRPVIKPAVPRPAEVRPPVIAPAQPAVAAQVRPPVIAPAQPAVAAEVRPAAPAEVQPAEEKKDLFRFVMRDIVIPVVVALAIALFAQAVLAKPYKIPSGSMLPTIQLEDRVLANRFIYRIWPIKRGDVVVFQPPETAGDTNTPFVKRVIGLSGDTVEVKKGKVLVNGQELVIEQAISPTYTKVAERVPDGMLFVLGDNRNESADSHIWGYLPKDNVIGRADVIYWPIPHIQWLG